MSNKREFTEEEINYILKNWGKESAYSMKKRFNCTWYAIAKIAERHGLPLPKSNAWTEKEVRKLKRLAPKYHYYIIAEKLGKSNNAVYLKARKLGIELIQNRKKWTKEDEDFLKEKWGYIPIEDIAFKLRRTIFSIKVKAIRMNLGSMLSNNENLTISEVSEILNISRDTIVGTWRNLGLKIEILKVSENQSYYIIDWDNLLKFLEENQNEWDSKNVEIFAFGYEPDWLVEKRKRDRIESPLLYRRWTEADIENAEWLLKCNKNYEEIGQLLHRSPKAVQQMLLSRGHAYRLPQFWKGRECKYLKENYQTMTSREMGEILRRTPKAVQSKVEELGLKRVREKK